MAKFTSEYVHGGAKTKADISVMDEDDDDSNFSVDLGDDDELEIELIEDDDKPAKELADEELDGDEELKQYSSGVRKRIAKEVGRRHEAERRASQREQDAADAIAYAKKIIDENEKLKKTSASIQRTAVDVTTASLQKNVDNIKNRLKQATDDGDTSAAVDLQVELNQAQMDLRDAKGADARLKEHETALEAEDKDDKPAGPQPRTETPKLSRVQVDWFEANKGWFKTDEQGRPMNEATEEALFLNAKAIRAGKDPSSQEFYDEINERLAKEYPDVGIPTAKKGKKKNEDDDFTAPRPSFSRSGGAGASKPKGKVVLSAREMRVIENLCPPHADKKEFIKRYIANKPKEG
jgi:hypothetical protein